MAINTGKIVVITKPIPMIISFIVGGVSIF